jgi:type II secretory pathway component PulK
MKRWTNRGSALSDLRRSTRSDRGVALLMALIMVVLLTAFVSEFNYGARVRILSAAHAEEDAKATMLGESGIRIYSLLLLFGRQAGKNPMLQQLMEQLPISLDGAAMVCQSIPFFDTAMLRFLSSAMGMNSDQEEDGLKELMGDGEGGGEDSNVGVRGKPDLDEFAQKGLRRKLLDFEGDFKVECSDIHSKINVNQFASPANTTQALLPLQKNPVAMMLYGLMSPARYDPLFEDRLKMDRWELIGNIKDYVDADEIRSGTFGGDENGEYDDYVPRYKAKNRPFDTTQELRMVAGFTDEVYATFAENMSVHARNMKVNVNSAPANIIYALLRSTTDPAIGNDIIQAKVAFMMFERRFSPYRNSRDFVNKVKQPSIPLPIPNLSGPAATGLPGIPLTTESEGLLRSMVRTNSNYFRLRSTGYVGDSARTIEVVVRVRSNRTTTLDRHVR